MDDLTRRFLRLLVENYPEQEGHIRTLLLRAVESDMDETLAPKRPRLAPRRPPVVVSNDVPVDELAQHKAKKALQRLGHNIK